MSANQLRLLAALACTLLGSCQAMYYTTMEKLGVGKRDILLERIEEAHDALQVVQVRVDNSMAAFNEVLGSEEDLEGHFDRFSDAYDRSENAGEEYHDAIGSIQVVAGLLFEEWKQDSAGITDAELRRASQQNYTKATARYERTLRAFRRVETRLAPVLTSFRDHVLYLKLNLHPHALRMLEENHPELTAEVTALNELIDKALNDGEEFIKAMSF